MKKIHWQEELELFPTAFWERYFSGCRIGVLDIETTGLNQSRDRFILGGLYDTKERIMHQVFAQTRGEEKEALEAFMDLVNRMDAVITYNGRHFDSAFLRERLAVCGLPAGPMPYDLDLYRMVSGHSPLRRFVPNLRQKTLENYMGLWSDRTDEISGGDSVELYDEYCRTQDGELVRQILLHNSDDVLQLTRLTRVLPKCDVHRAMYKMGFPAGSPGRMVHVERIDFHRDRLLISGLQKDDPIAFRCYELDGQPVFADFDPESGGFRAEVPLVLRSGICVVDLRALNMGEHEFDGYPTSGSGFLVLREGDEYRCREINHFVRRFIQRIETETRPGAPALQDKEEQR